MNALRRSTGAPPVRLVHLGLGNFFRAHQAWYTTNASNAPEWGIAAFTGRSSERSQARVAALRAQDGLYTVITRAAAGCFAAIQGCAGLPLDHRRRAIGRRRTGR